MTKAKEFIGGLRTICDFIRWGGSNFQKAELCFGHGTDNAIDEAAALVLHALNLPPDLPQQYLQSRLTKPERKIVENLLLRRLRERIPVAYLTQRGWFAGLEFYVDERVLIPRSPIAELIENNLQPWVNANQLKRVLDLGTGSGCIGIAIAKYFTETEVDLVDISLDALDVANLNVERFDLNPRVRTIHSDLFANLRPARYDLIISNPPYVTSSEFSGLPEEYTYEPSVGLSAGTHGLDVVHRILRDASRYLEPQGVLIVEVGESAVYLENAYPQVPFTWLHFERGGIGVFLLTYDQLVQWDAVFQAQDKVESDVASPSNTTDDTFIIAEE